MGRGWISIHRGIEEHWIWQDPYLRWWLSILLGVNHTAKKVLLGNRIIECGRGQSVCSLGTWAKKWDVDVGKVRRFFDMLKKDGMIVTENVVKSTRITVCNYDRYQSARIRNEFETATNNNVNNVNNEIKDREEKILALKNEVYKLR